MVGTLLARGIVPAWLAAGALFKLTEMNPALLPLPVRAVLDALADGFSLSKQEFYGPALRTIVAIELALALIMVLVPSVSRWVAAGVMALFVLILGVLLLQDQSSCGCFGANGPPPWVMMMVDGAMLVGVLALPVRRCASSGRKVAKTAGSIVLAGAAGALLAFTWQPATPEPHTSQTTQTNQTTQTTPPTPPTPPVDPPPPPPAPPSAQPSQPQPAVPAEGPRPWPPAPPKLQQYYAPEFEKWAGKRLDQQDLALIIQRPLPVNLNEGRLHIVFMREDCDHCHELLNQYFSGPLDTTTVAVIIPDATGEPLENPCVNCKMAMLVKGVPYVIQTPVLMTVKDGIVLDVCADVDKPEAVRKTLNAGK